MGKKDKAKKPDEENSPEAQSETSSEPKSEPKQDNSKDDEIKKLKEKNAKIDLIEDFRDFLEDNKEAQTFWGICIITGEVTEDQFKKWTEFDKEQWMTKFEQWKKIGSPTPSMPKIPKSEIRYPTHAYRIRDKGVDKMYVYYSDRTKDGMEEKKIFEEIENPEAPGQMVSTGVIKQTVEVYTKKFTVEEAKKIIEQAEKLNPTHNPLRLYFWVNSVKSTISPENFLKDYAVVVDMINKRQPIN